ncbi:hypothetical protein ERJ75_001599100 [Trypanosoma vivax]|uniref:Uncharacterized protein n=1 Tax=Trypanosoma vivax (strain Y486) TaxID=1055687 RepID=G0TSJ1_TRYVY|nr:hypothetical protein ERJ75_001599100 [Trypanosoma vivax]CCC46918.1 conserved hypothetical protein [Trypanosoma vivax Y486]
MTALCKTDEQLHAQEGEPDCRFWWTHGRLTDEAAASCMCPNAEGVILSCLEQLKEKAHTAIDMLSSQRKDLDSADDRPEAATNGVLPKVWHEELVLLRDKLVEAFNATQQQRAENQGDTTLLRTHNGEPADSRGLSVVLRRAHLLLIKTIFSAWVARSVANGRGNADALLSSLLDALLDGMAFTHSSLWGAGDCVGVEDAEMAKTVAHFLQNSLGMTPTEQSQYLPEFVRHSWESFVSRLAELEEKVHRCCGASTQHNEEAESDPQTQQLIARDLVANIACVFELLDVRPSAVAAATGASHGDCYVVVTTAEQAGVIVQSLGRWLPECGEFLLSLAPRDSRGERTQCRNANESEVNGSKGDIGGGQQEINTAVVLTATEARAWVHRVERQLLSVCRLLEQLEGASPWLVVVADIASRALRLPVIAPCKDADDGDAVYNSVSREHRALRAWLGWHKRVLYGTAFPESARSTAPQTLMEACSACSRDVLMSVLVQGETLNDLKTRALRLLLLHRSISTLRQVAQLLCPTSSLEKDCDFEAVITDKLTSDARAAAYTEESLQENGVVSIYFPKLFEAACILEKCLVSICAEVENLLKSGGGGGVSDPAAEAAMLVEKFFGASLDESLAEMETGGSANVSCTSMSEWLMFLAFICSDAPLFSSDSLRHIRRAARLFFAPGLPMMRSLHNLILRRKLHGLVAFFLPPLRAIGIDHSTAPDASHMSCALRYPRSAEVAYLQELPRGYYSRQPHRLALNAKNDALHFFHEILMFTTSGKEDDKMKKLKEERVATRRLFVDIVAHIGTLVIARLRGDMDRRSLGGAVAYVAMDAMVAFFLSVMRLCSGVLYWNVSQRHEVQQAIAEQLIGSVVTASSPLACFSKALLLRGGCTLGDGNSAASLSANKGEEVDANEDTGTELPHAWSDWFCAVELEDIDPRASVCAMTLLRNCNRIYMKSIPTRTLLACRATLEQNSSSEKEANTREKTIAAMELAIRQDINVLQIQQWEKKNPKSGIGSSACGGEDEKKLETSPSGEGGKETEMGASKSFAPAAGDKSVVVPGENQLPHDFAHEPLTSATLKPYIEAVSATLVMRARMSVVDGVVAAVAMKKWLVACAGKLEPRMLLEVVRRVVLHVSTKLIHATKHECLALSALLGTIVNEIALPYELSFFNLRSSSGSQAQWQEDATTPSSSSDVEWLRTAFPSHVRDANILLHTLIVESTRLVVRFLGESTPLGDWKAYIVTSHLRCIMGLVRRHEASLREAIKKRREALGSRSVLSQSARPIDLLSRLELPLLEKMTTLAVDVDHLFSNASQLAAAPSKAVGAAKASAARGDYDSGAPHGDDHRRKRERAEEEQQVHHSRGWRSSGRDRDH